MKHNWRDLGYTIGSEFKATRRLQLEDDLLPSQKQQRCTVCRQQHYLGEWVDGDTAIRVYLNTGPCKE